jgi:ABC-type molybdate transport system substrate-binding protein
MSLIFSKQLKNRKSLALINIIDNNWPDFLIKKIFKFGKINRHTSPMGIRTENMALLAGLHYKKEYPLFLKAWQNNFNKENIYSEYDLMIRDLENGKIDLCFSYYAAAHAAGFEPVNLAPEFNLNGFLSWQKSSLARVEVKYPDYLPEVTAKTYEIAQPVTFCMAIAEEKLKSSPQNISGAASEFLKLFFDSANLIFSKCGLKSLHIVEDTKFLLHIH